jgi:hypothetical protein
MRAEFDIISRDLVLQVGAVVGLGAGVVLLLAVAGWLLPRPLLF